MPDVLDLITANLALAVTGCHTAVNHYLTRQRRGSIVNVSSHQAQRPVRGALPYSTAKAAVEALTKAIAVDHASFITGVILPIDGGRAAQGTDPEEI